MNAAINIMMALVCAYLIGAISGSLLLGRLKGVDIRTQGSGNAGATNALRTQGIGFGLGTAVIDVAKAVVAVALIAPLFQVNPMLLLCAAVMGHCFPIYHQFRGGKGASVAVGGLAWIAPQLTLITVATWIITLMLSGFVGPSTVLAAAVAALLALLAGPYFNIADPISQGLACIIFALVISMHHANIRRFWLGTEPRFERVRWLHRLIKARRP